MESAKDHSDVGERGAEEKGISKADGGEGREHGQIVSIHPLYSPLLPFLLKLLGFPAQISK